MVQFQATALGSVAVKSTLLCSTVVGLGFTRKSAPGWGVTVTRSVSVSTSVQPSGVVTVRVTV